MLKYSNLLWYFSVIYSSINKHPIHHNQWLVGGIFTLAWLASSGCRLSISNPDDDGSISSGPACPGVVCQAPAVCIEPTGQCRNICDNDIPCVNDDPCQTMIGDGQANEAQSEAKEALCASFTCNAGGFLSCQMFDPCMIDSCDPTLGCLHESVTDVECAVDELCVSEIPAGSTFQGRLGDCAKRCTQAGDCDDGNECTTDACEVILLPESSTEGLCANAVIESCVVVGACCTKDGCFELTESDCTSQNVGEVYQGDGTTCNPSPCFGDFIPGSYTLAGNCPGDGTMVTLIAEANTLILRNLPENGDIPLTVIGAIASATGVVVSGVGDQDVSLAVLADGTMLLDISQQAPGTSCRSTMTLQ